MTLQIAVMSEAEATRTAAPHPDSGLGALRTERGNLPLDLIDVTAEIVGLTTQVTLTQEFVNVHEEPLEATYVFPLPDRAAVTGMRMTAADRMVEATLRERGEARQAYDDAIAAGQRAAIAEEERPDVFTMRVGNIVPGERVSVTLTLAGALAVEDGEATFRFPLVVAPRYIPGAPLDGDGVGAGHADDTDAVPDASRITPPVLLPGFPNPVRLAIEVGVDAAGLPLADARCSLHTVVESDGRIRIQPGERADRDFVLRLPYGAPERSVALTVVPDETGDEGTYQLTVLPPAGGAAVRPRDVVLVLDRSGSMEGWKMVAARRAAARIVDTLSDGDRFAVLAFDHLVETPDRLPGGLVTATDRHRFRAVEHLARMTARGATELMEPLRRALRLLTPDCADQDPDCAEQDPDCAEQDPDCAEQDRGDAPRDRVLVLVTDGQVGNEDQILREVGGALGQVRVHTVGIDQAVNAGFLGRLASVGGGRCELVESEDRLDAAMASIHRRIGSPLVTAVRLTASGFATVEGTQAPQRLPDLFDGVPYVVQGRYRGEPAGSVTLAGTTREGRPWSVTAEAKRCGNPVLRAVWGRAVLRDLEDRYAALSLSSEPALRDALERRIVQTSLRFGVLCRFTAYVAVDSRQVTEGDGPHSVVQPVEYPAGWQAPGAPPMPVPMVAPAPMMVAPAAMAMGSRGPAFAPSALAGTGTAAGGSSDRLGAGTPGPSAAVARAAGRVARRLLRATGRDAENASGAPGSMISASGTDEAAGGAVGDLRRRVAAEADRLRQAQEEPEYRRWELLEDLGTRLAALACDASQAEAQVLRALADRLSADRLSADRSGADRSGGRPLDDLWDEALRVLDAVAAGSPAIPAEGGETGGASNRRSGAFWK